MPWSRYPESMSEFRSRLRREDARRSAAKNETRLGVEGNLTVSLPPSTGGFRLRLRGTVTSIEPLDGSPLEGVAVEHDRFLGFVETKHGRIPVEDYPPGITPPVEIKEDGWYIPTQREDGTWTWTLERTLPAFHPEAFHPAPERLARLRRLLALRKAVEALKELLKVLEE